MIGRSKREQRTQRHGNIFSPSSGFMYVHVQRENSLAHHTMVLRPWQVQALRVLTSRLFLVALGVGLASWGYFAAQAARVPLLTWRINHLEQDALRIDALQRTLTQLQSRYEQVQRMLAAPAVAKTRPVDTTKGIKPDTATLHAHP